MVYPFVANKVEQLELDPVKKIDGYIWYNTVEKVYKTWIGDTIHIFLTDFNFGQNINDLIQDKLDIKQFTVSFKEVYSLVIKHNKNSHFFNYTILDTNENTQIHSSLEIINDNEVKVDFVDPVTGHIFMYFQ